jgi:hypothetical protein
MTPFLASVLLLSEAYGLLDVGSNIVRGPGLSYVEAVRARILWTEGGVGKGAKRVSLRRVHSDSYWGRNDAFPVVAFLKRFRVWANFMS